MMFDVLETLVAPKGLGLGIVSDVSLILGRFKAAKSSSCKSSSLRYTGRFCPKILRMDAGSKRLEG